MIRFSYHSSFSGSMDVMLFREHSETVRDSTLETVIVHPTNIWILSQTIFRFSLSINLSSGCNQHECLLFLDYVMLSYFCSVEQEKRPQLKRRRAYYLFLSSTSQTQASHLDSRLEARRMIFSKVAPIKNAPHIRLSNSPLNNRGTVYHRLFIYHQCTSLRSPLRASFFVKNSDGSASRKPSLLCR